MKSAAAFLLLSSMATAATHATLARAATCETWGAGAEVFHVTEDFQELGAGKARVTVTAFDDAACRTPRAAFRATGDLVTKSHVLAGGARVSVSRVAATTLEAAAWSDEVLAALNGDEGQSPACGRAWEAGRFVATGKACLDAKFFARDAAKFLRLAIGEQFLF